MEPEIPNWMKDIGEEEWNFIKRFLLASGSLKDVARQYNISYPTIRLRMDRLIEKIKAADTPTYKSSFHRKVQLLVADGKLDYQTAKKLINAFQEARKELDSHDD